MKYCMQAFTLLRVNWNRFGQNKLNFFVRHCLLLRIMWACHVHVLFTNALWYIDTDNVIHAMTYRDESLVASRYIDKPISVTIRIAIRYTYRRPKYHCISCSLQHCHCLLHCRPVTDSLHTANASIVSDDSALSITDNDSSLSNKAASLSLSRPPTKPSKALPLYLNARSKMGDYELKILEQPEQQHRARYLTEGSRGAIKDKSQEGHPVVKVG